MWFYFYISRIMEIKLVFNSRVSPEGDGSIFLYLIIIIVFYCSKHINAKMTIIIPLILFFCKNHSLLHLRSENPWFRIYLSLAGAQRRRNTTCAMPSAAFSSICCVYPLPRDPSRRGRYCRFAYFVCVVHFRKLLNTQKFGSHRNGHPVI